MKIKYKNKNRNIQIKLKNLKNNKIYLINLNKIYNL